jgi:hypothetical protein
MGFDSTNTRILFCTESICSPFKGRVDLVSTATRNDLVARSASLTIWRCAPAVGCRLGPDRDETTLPIHEHVQLLDKDLPWPSVQVSRGKCSDVACKQNKINKAWQERARGPWMRWVLRGSYTTCRADHSAVLRTSSTGTYKSIARGWFRCHPNSNFFHSLHHINF